MPDTTHPRPLATALVARVPRIDPAVADVASGQLLLRRLAPPRQMVELFGWGDQARQQAEAAGRVGLDRCGPHLAPDAMVNENPAAGVRL